MSLTPISPTPASTSNQIDPSVPTVPTVELSFNTSKGGAWDDRELIKASEAAMKEFHIHHPGPGSWLDKATAALAAGKKLPGADDFGTAWYSASLPDETQQPEASTSTLTSTSAGPGPGTVNPYNVNSSYNQNQNQNQNKRRRTRKSNGYDNLPNSNSNIPNPYAPSTSSSFVNANGGSTINRRGRGISPIYQPLSPSDRVNSNGTALDDDDEEDDEYLDGDDDEEEEQEEEEEYDEDAEWEIPNSHQYRHQENSNSNQQISNSNGYDQLFPSLGVYPPGGINREEALGYAMTAQYWAGYWMGVAQSHQQPQQQQQPFRPNRENQGNERTTIAKNQGKSQKRKNTKQVDFALETNLNSNGNEIMVDDEDDDMDGFVEPNFDVAIHTRNGRETVNGDNPSNIKITRKQFDRPILDLRR